MMKFKTLRGVLLLGILLSLFACSGGGDGDGDGTIGTGLEGTVAVGKAISGATVTIKDVNGKKDSTITSIDGSYNFSNIQKMKGPFLLKVDVDSKTSLFSIAKGSGRANVHPLTDVVARNWYKKKNAETELEDAFNSDAAIATVIDTLEIQATVEVIESLLRLAYIKFGVDTNFDFLSSKFSAKHVNSKNVEIAGSKFDVLLDHIEVEIDDNKITIKLEDPETGLKGKIVVEFDLEDDLLLADTSDPSDPTGLSIIPGGSNSLVLLWNSSIDNIGVAGYEIYKGNSNTVLASSPYPVFVDTFDWLVDTEYCYSIKAVDVAGNTSQLVTKCYTPISDADEVAPIAPSSLAVRTLGSFANNVTWIPSPDDVIGYDIYRDINDAANYSKINTVIGSSIDLLGLEAETKYCYYTEAIKIIKVVGNESFGSIRSAPSNTACITTDAVDPNNMDTTAPITLATPAGGIYTSAQSVVLSCADGGGDGCANTYFTLDGSDPSTNSSQYTLPLNVTNNTMLKYFSIDGAGNVESFHTQFYSIASEKPKNNQVSIVSAPSNPSNVTYASFSFIATDTGSTFKCSIDGQAYVNCSSPMIYPELAEGIRDFNILTTDSLGNVDPTPINFSWLVDSIPPDTSITVKPTNPTSSVNASFSFTSTEQGSSFVCEIDGSGTVDCTSPIDFPNLALGNHTFTVRSTDSAGNVDPAVAVYQWVVAMNSTPETTINSGPTSIGKATNATFDFTSSEAGSSFQCALDSPTFTTCTSPWSITLLEGPHTFRVQATNTSGQTDTTPAVYDWIIDTTAPVLTAPPAITLNAGGGGPIPASDSAVQAFLAAATATDTVDGDVSNIVTTGVLATDTFAV
ncbi:MAG: chitobiase/beta-hexosaminidase C-terminal domain-containing protein, partial [Thiohalomonadales bacterium]